MQFTPLCFLLPEGQPCSHKCKKIVYGMQNQSTSWNQTFLTTFIFRLVTQAKSAYFPLTTSSHAQWNKLCRSQGKERKTTVMHRSQIGQGLPFQGSVVHAWPADVPVLGTSSRYSCKCHGRETFILKIGLRWLFGSNTYNKVAVDQWNKSQERPLRNAGA